MTINIARLLIIMVSLSSAITSAGEFGLVAEFGVGYAPMPMDGTYWQERMDHDSQMKDRMFSIGLAYKTDRYNIIAAYDDLGQRQIWTYGVPDNDYSHLEDDGLVPGESPCGGCSGYFYTREQLSAIRFAVSTPDSMSLYAEAGLILYKSDLRMDLIQIPDHNHIKLNGDGELLIGFSVAGGYRITDNMSIVGRYYRTTGDSGMPVMADDVYTISLQVSW